MINNNKEKLDENDLSLTMQQKFNFSSNELEEEDISIKNKVTKKKQLNKKMMEIIDIKEKYKRKYYIFFILFFVTIIFTVGIICYNVLHPVIRTKQVVAQNIVFLGDSLTEIYNLDHFYGKNANVVNSGVSGHTTADILDNMKERVYRYNPSKVILLIGTNDIETGKSDKEILKNIKKIVYLINKKRPLSDIYIESLYPVNNTENEVINHTMVGSRTNNRIIELNKKIKCFCNNSNLVYINMYDELLDDDGNLKMDYTKDGLHLNEKGFEIVTEKIKNYI